MIARGGPGVGPAAGRLTRIPPGSRKGYLEGFANLYGDAAELIWAADRGAGARAGGGPAADRTGRADGHAVHRGGAAVRPANGAWTKLRP